MTTISFPAVAPSTSERPSDVAQEQAERLVLVPLDQIDVPEEWREIDERRVCELANSIGELGLLQPIGLWLRETGRYGLVFGRHRMLAVQQLGWTAIQARVLPTESEEHRQVMTDIENLCRVALAPAAELLAFKRWHAWYVKRNPDSVKHASQRNKEQAEARREGKEPSPSAERFDRKAAEVTGKDASTIRRKLSIASAIGEEALQKLTSLNVSGTDLKKLAAIEDEDIRKKAIALAVLGTLVDEAIRDITAPPGERVEHTETRSIPIDRPPLAEREEKDLTHEEWLERYCKDVIKRIRDPRQYMADAILYRRIHDARMEFRNRTKQALAQSKQIKPGPFAYALMRIVNVDHPATWLVCGPCQGTGYVQKGLPCPHCKTNGYSLTTISVRR
jgi:hypothetical protein